MITELVVHDLGVFAHARLPLGAGLHVLSGETGAGKSLVVGAIELLLGARADGSVVRPGAAEAVVDGRFLDRSGDEVVLSRVVPVDGRSRAYVNGRPVTVGELAEIGRDLVELHGQHAHQRLLRADAQRRALDRYGAVDLGPLRELDARLAAIDDALASLGGDDRTRARELDLLGFQLDELDGAGLSDPGEDEVLDAEEDALADAVAHQELGARLDDALSGDDGLADRIASLIGRVGGRGPFVDIERRLRDVGAEVSDLAAEVRTLVDGITDDPERLSEVRTRRQVLADLRRKYGDTLVEVMAERDRIRDRLDELTGHGARVAELESERDQLAADRAAAAAVVAEQRRRHAPRLAAAVEARLRALAMPDARVEVAVGGDDPGDEVVFLLAANPGAPPAPMTKVASGGELSRLTLALRLELMAGPPTLVFDEVDAGIGGATAWSVGEAIDALAGSHQILVVTHLAQVAAFATGHLVVHKSADADSTTAEVRALDHDDRITELARMLSGEPDSTAGRDHVRDLLARVDARRGDRAEGAA